MPCLGLSKRNLNIGLLVLAAFALSCETEVHERGVNAIAGPGGVRKNKTNLMIKAVRPLDIT